MRKTLYNAFVLSLFAFFLLNFLFWIMGFSLEGELDPQFRFTNEEPRYFLVRLVYPMILYPWELIEMAMTSDINGTVVMMTGYFISLIISAIVAGLAAGRIWHAIGGWALTCVFCMILAFSGVDLLVDTLEYGVIDIFLSGFVNFLLFGLLSLFFALLANKLRNRYSKDLF
ncbi:MAG: hypothetical protein ACFFAS_05540 [Promethearchaeota archaeon]